MRLHGHHATGRLLARRTRAGSRPSVVRGGDRCVGTGVIRAFPVAGLAVLSTPLLARAMVAERSKRLLGGLVPDRDSAAPTLRVPRNVLVAMGIVAGWLLGGRVAGR